MYRHIIAVCLAALAIGAATAQTQPLTTLEYLSDNTGLIERDFARCSVIRERQALALEKVGNSDTARRTHQIAESARYIANFYAATRNLPTAYTSPEQQQQTLDAAKAALANVQSIVDAETERQRAFDQRGEVDTGQLAFCISLEKTQAFLHQTITEARTSLR